MKPSPAPDVPGNTPWERLDSAVRTIFSVPKVAYLKKEARLKKRREKKKQEANKK
jgi:hypothetical protein